MYQNSNINSSYFMGLSLIELLISMSLSLIIASLLFHTILMNQKNFRYQLALHEIEDHAQLVSSILHTELKKAGHIGCAHLSKSFSFISPLPFNDSNKLEIKNNMLCVRYQDFPRVRLNGISKDLTSLDVSAESRFSKNDWMIISDCAHAEMFQIKKIIFYPGHQVVFPVVPLHHSFSPDAEVAPYIEHYYFISKTSRKNQDGSLVYSLFVREKNRNLELIDNVQQMLITPYWRYNDNKKKLVGLDIELVLFSFPLTKHWFVYSSLI